MGQLCTIITVTLILSFKNSGGAPAIMCDFNEVLLGQTTSGNVSFLLDKQKLRTALSKVKGDTNLDVEMWALTPTSLGSNPAYKLTDSSQVIQELLRN